MHIRLNKKGFVWLPILLAILAVLTVSGGAYWYESTSATDGDWDRGVTIPQPAGESCNWECPQGYGHGDSCGSCIPLKNGDASSSEHTIVRWNFPQDFLDSFPKDFDLYVFLYVQKKDDPTGVNSSSIGDGWPAVLGEIPWTPSLGTYKIYAQFQAIPHDSKRLCAIQKGKDCSPTPEDAAIMARGGPVKAESEFFTITQEKSAPVISLSFNSISVPDMSKYTINLDMVSVTVHENSDQTISLSDSAKADLQEYKGTKAFLTDLDINFDGIPDLGVLYSIGEAGANVFYEFYIYNENGLIKLDISNGDSGISNPTIDAAKKQLVSGQRSGLFWYSYTYQFNGTGYDKPMVTEYSF